MLIFNVEYFQIFDYERLVEILLYIVSAHNEAAGNFVQRAGICLLNSLACQVEGRRKLLVGDLGAMEKMLGIIQERLRSSMLWRNIHSLHFGIVAQGAYLFSVWYISHVIVVQILMLHFICTENCDEVLETAWSTMWNVTDETPINCQRFLVGGGMQLFLQCKEVSTNIWYLSKGPGARGGYFF